MEQTLGRALAVLIQYALFLVEGGAVLLSTRLALRRSKFCDGLFRKVECSLGRLARRRRLAVVVVGLVALAGRAALLPIFPVRIPAITDEYSYMLASHTFASGRLTSPTHPMWVHFETMHINQRPTYMSMYPPAQGLVMAAGERFAGSPWGGCLAEFGPDVRRYLLDAPRWFPPGWALLGFLAVLRIGLFSYWASSYWGGAVAALGGALVLVLCLASSAGSGSAIRSGLRWVLRSWRTAAPTKALSFAWRSRGRFWPGRSASGARGFRLSRSKVVAPLILVLALTGAAMLYYNQRLTGDPLRLPYQVNRDDYVSGRYFLWDSFNSRAVYRHSSLRDYYVTWQSRIADGAMTVPGFLMNALQNLGFFWLFTWGRRSPSR